MCEKFVNSKLRLDVNNDLRKRVLVLGTNAERLTRFSLIFS